MTQIDKRQAAQLLQKSFPSLAKERRLLAVGAKPQIIAAYAKRGITIPPEIVDAGLQFHTNATWYQKSILRGGVGARRYNVDGSPSDTTVTETHVIAAKRRLASYRARTGAGQ